MNIFIKFRRNDTIVTSIDNFVKIFIDTDL